MPNVRTGLALGLTAALVAMASVPANAQADVPGDAPEVRFFADCDDTCPEMAVVPAGSFTMGTDGGEEGRPEGPPHKVVIARPFALARLEVTNADYARFLKDTGRKPSAGCWSFDFAAKQFQFDEAADYKSPGDGAGDAAPDMPAVCVSWHDAQAYVGWLSEKTGHAYRLPTEAEWEYAARAGADTIFPWGDDIGDGCVHANIYDVDGAPVGFSGFVSASSDETLVSLDHAACSDGHLGAAPVASYRANAFGLYDMIGNVWEWTQDCYEAPYPANVPVDGSAFETEGSCKRRSVRGGSWITSPFRIRPAWRGRDPEDQLSWIFGFRVARDLSDEEAG